VATIRVLIIDDHMLFAEAVQASLEDLGLEVIGVRATAGQGIAAARSLRPDVILIDLGLPDQSGLAAGNQILEQWPEATIIALTALNDRSAADEALRLGFRGYLTKDTPVAQFVNAVRSANDGHLVLPQRLSPVAGRSAEEQNVWLMAHQLTARERQVLELLVRGANGQVVSESLGISRNTVRTHVQNILTKLQVHSRLEAATFAVRHGIVTRPGPGSVPPGIDAQAS
jgi:two-component system nitrate/nitrite response regulator NarL